MRIGLVVMSLLGLAVLAVRPFAFLALRTKWDTSAYGSVIWLLLGLHTAHVLTDLADTLVLTALMFTRHAGNPRRDGDVEDNAMYWSFVVLTWLPIGLVLCGAPRLRPVGGEDRKAAPPPDKTRSHRLKPG